MYKNENDSKKLLNVISDRAMWKCHLAFLAPTNNISWSSTANDTFRNYQDRFSELSVTVPRLMAPSSTSTGIILWGLRKNVQDMNGLDADCSDWTNINLQMVYQGVAQPTVPIERFNDFLPSEDVRSEMNKQMVHHMNDECQLSDETIKGANRKKVRKCVQWLPVQLSRSIEFTGKYISSVIFCVFNATMDSIEFQLTAIIEYVYNRNTCAH